MIKLLESMLLSKFAQQFIVIHETKSMRKAAEILTISQPALSINLRKTEERLGAPLFIRQANGMESTPLGDVLYNHTKSILNASRLLEDEIEFLTNRSKKKASSWAWCSLDYDAFTKGYETTAKRVSRLQF